MMRFKFLGTPQCPEAITLRDTAFPVGKVVEVDDALAAKLANLEYFAEVKRGPKPKAASDDENEA